MSRGVHLLLLLIATIVPAVCSAADDSKDRRATNIASRKQLFIDGNLIENSRGVRLTKNRPRQTGELLVTADQKWETSANAYVWDQCTVRKENGKLRLWYQLITLKNNPGLLGPVATGQSMAYAESTDGIRFTKPDLNLHSFHGSKSNSIVVPVSRGGTVWIDPTAPPEQRYRSQTKNPKGRVTFHHSADGIHWKKTHEVAIGDCDTQNIAFFDKHLGRYVLYTRRWVRFPDKEGNYRMHRRLESDDLVHWENETVVLRADEKILASLTSPTKQPPVDYYGACIFQYPDDDGPYIALVPTFWHWFDRSPQNLLGPNTIDVRLHVSRDGKNFEYVGDRSPFLPLGPEGSFYSRMVWPIPGPIRMGDELWIYFWGSNMDHAGYIDPQANGKHLTGIGRAIMRVDGFVSADADYTGGELVTGPIVFTGDALELNLETGGGGSVRVEVLDEQDRPISGFTAEQTIPLSGNSVHMPAKWRNAPNIGSLAGKTIKLRFLMQDCKLYAFQFKTK